MKNNNPKKIYTPETYEQAQKDFIEKLKKLKDDFSNETNVMPIIREKDITFYMNITGQ